MNKLQLKPRELKIISVIAATHSIGDAAALLGMAQANVSKYLSDFETRVGLKVFERTTRQLSLTQFGEALLPYVNATLDKNSQLVNFIADYKHEKRGKVTIYAPTGIVTYLARHVIHQIEDIGDIRISLKTYNLDRNEYSEGVSFPDDCDILITYAPPKDESLVASVLTKYSVTAFATVDYLNSILTYIIFIGAVGLCIVAVIPIFFNGYFGANVSFGGTSIIIIAGVVLETMKQIESQTLVRQYTGFLTE